MTNDHRFLTTIMNVGKKSITVTKAGKEKYLLSQCFSKIYFKNSEA